MRRVPCGRASAALAVLLLLAACANSPMRRLERNPDILAVVGRYFITRTDLASALTYNQVPDTQDPLIQSRIWDGLVNSVLILNDAATGPVPHAPVSLGPYSDPKVRDDQTGAELEENVYSKINVLPGEVERYYQQHLADYRRGEGVLLRTILVSGLKQAQDAEKLLRAGHSFGDVARLYSVSPDRGSPQYFQSSELPDYLRDRLAQASPGVPTEPIRVSDEFYQIVLVQQRCTSYVLPLEEVAPQIRLTLSDAKGDRLLKEYLSNLRQRFQVVVFWSKLPFRYQKETP